MSKADISTTPIRSRRAVLAGIASAAVIPTAALTTAAAAAAQILDAELVELGARFEPLVDRYYVAHRRWSAALAQAHAEHDREFGRPAEKAFEDSCKRWDVCEASDTLSAIFKEMTPLVNAINAASVTSIEGFRAKALVAFWEVAPLGAGDSEFTFEDAWPFQQLFTAAAELCGLKGKIAATGYALPDIGMVEAAPDDDSDDDGEEA
jgi:hypothetical protein